jgi:serine protease Do
MLLMRLSTLPVFCAALLMPPVHAQTFDVDALAPAVVQVRTESGTGSGSLIVDGNEVLLLTNRHVVSGDNEVTVAVLVDVNEPAMPMFRAGLRAFSATYDLALFQVTSDLDGRPVSAGMLLSGDHPSGYVLPRLTMAPSDRAMGRGETISILGYPGLADNELVYTTGTIASVQMQDVGGERVAGWYRTNGEMSPGNSGGVALDQQGRVIGIPTAVHTEQTTGGRLGSLLATPLAMRVLDGDDLMADWEEYRASGGVLAIDESGRFGEYSVSSANVASRYTHSFLAGGSNDVSYLGDGCVGHAASQPDFLLTVTEPLGPLSLQYTAEGTGDDAVMVVRDPEGRWLCNDDAGSETLDPALQLDQAAPGDYRIWVGSYQSGALFNGELGIGPVSSGSASGAVAGLEWNETPYFGEVELERYFVPDPHSVIVLSGGTIDVREQGYGSGCVGHASRRPDVRLRWSGSTERLRVYFLPDTAGDDATLIVNASDGSWVCNDDAHGSTLDPEVSLGNVGEGRFDIWVGSYSSGDTIEGTLYFTELEDNAP